MTYNDEASVPDGKISGIQRHGISRVPETVQFGTLGLQIPTHNGLIIPGIFHQCGCTTASSLSSLTSNLIIIVYNYNNSAVCLRIRSRRKYSGNFTHKRQRRRCHRTFSYIDAVCAYFRSIVYTYSNSFHHRTPPLYRSHSTICNGSFIHNRQRRHNQPFSRSPSLLYI